MTDQMFHIEKHPDGVAVITLSRPEKRNALRRDFWENFPDAIEELDRAGDVRCIVITADGDHFCAGIDLGMFEGRSDKRDAQGANAGLAFMHHLERMQRTFNVLEDARVPVIAAIQGYCVGAGVDLITACDIRLSDVTAKFSIFEINIGMTADVGTFPRILNHLPEGVVRELSYTGRMMEAAEGERRGLINTVYPDKESVQAAAIEMAKTIAAKAPLAIHGCKKAITYGRDHSTKDALDFIGYWNASMLRHEEIEATQAAKKTGVAPTYASLPPKLKLTEE